VTKFGLTQSHPHDPQETGVFPVSYVMRRGVVGKEEVVERQEEEVEGEDEGEGEEDDE